MRAFQADWRFRASKSAADIMEHGLDFQTLGYRAPEVLFGDARFGKPIDAFSFGAIVLELAGCRRLRPAKSQPLTAAGFAMTLLQALGSPPPESALRGLPLYPKSAPSFLGPRPFEAEVEQVIGAFGLSFAKSLLRWSPAERSTAHEASQDSFLNPCNLSLGGEAEAQPGPALRKASGD